MIKKLFILTLLLTTISSACFAQWKKVYDSPSTRPISLVFIIGNNILIRDQGGILLSTDDAKNWKFVDTTFGMKVVSKIIAKDSLLLASSLFKGVYRSLDSGRTWIAPSKWFNDYTTDIILSGKNILGILPRPDQIIVSKDDGVTWDTATKSPPYILSFNGNIDALGIIGNTTFAFYAGKLYTSYDYGETWKFKSDSCPTGASPTVYNDKILSNSLDGNIAVSEDSGMKWKTVFTGQQGINHVGRIRVSGKILIAPVKNEGVIFSYDSGNTWIFKNDGLGSVLGVYDISLSSDFVYCGADSGRVFRRPISEFNDIESPVSLLTDAFQLKVYPNPANQFTNFEFGRALANGSLSIYDITGKEVLNISNINTGKYTFQRDNTPGGTYMYMLKEHGKKLAFGKLVLE